MILIIGAGISGLVLAFELEKKGVDYLLFESESTPGGYMKSIQIKDYLLELGPNTILANSELKTFLYELGLNDQILIPEGKNRNRYVLKNGKLKQLPSGPFSFFFGNFFSWKTKKAIINEMRLKSSGNGNETVGDFFERRFNKEVVDYVINPFVSGIFAGDPYRLIVDKTFPLLSEMENKYGSIIKGFLKSKGDKKESVVFKNGTKRLVDALTKDIKNIFCNTKVLSLKKDDNKYYINYIQGKELGKVVVDKVVITSPAYVAGEILKEFDPEISYQFSKINYCTMVKIFVGFKKRDIGQFPEGFGVLNPACEKQFSLGTIWNSSINDFSCPDDRYLFTVMVGGTHNEDKTRELDKVIINKVTSELKRIYMIKHDPDFTFIHRIPNAIPQYDSNILEIDSIVKDLKKQDIFICSNWHNGTAVSDCIKKAIQLSEDLSQKSTD